MIFRKTSDIFLISEHNAKNVATVKNFFFRNPVILRNREFNLKNKSQIKMKTSRKFQELAVLAALAA